MSHLNGTLEEFKYYFQNTDLKDRKILDVGCRDHNAYSKLNELGLIWTGIDIKPTHPQGEIITMDMVDLKFIDNSFDIIFICHSLEHCENPIKALREFNRVLKEEGYLFISLPCHCEHHILKSDEDHIFCFTQLQIERLLFNCKYNNIKTLKSYKGYSEPDMYNLIAVAQKNKK